MCAICTAKSPICSVWTTWSRRESSAETQRSTTATGSDPDEATQLRRKEVQKNIQALQDEVKLFSPVQSNTEHFELQEQRAEGQIRQKFLKLH